MYHCVPIAISRMLPQLMEMFAATNQPTTSGNVMLTGNDAPICASGWAKRATRGWKPIQTPTGVQTIVASTVIAITRSIVRNPSHAMCPNRPQDSAPRSSSAAATRPVSTS